MGAGTPSKSTLVLGQFGGHPAGAVQLEQGQEWRPNLAGERPPIANDHDTARHHPHTLITGAVPQAIDAQSVTQVHPVGSRPPLRPRLCPGA